MTSSFLKPHTRTSSLHYPTKKECRVHKILPYHQLQLTTNISFYISQQPPTKLIMAPKKRKTNPSESKEASLPLAKSGRGRPANPNSAPKASSSSLPKRKSPKVQETASSSRPKRSSPATKEAATVSRTSKSGGVSKPVGKSTKATKVVKGNAPAKPEKATKSASKSRLSKKNSLKERRGSSVSIEIPRVYTTTADAVDAGEGDENHEGPAYWLMKAEPESRIEKGKDVKFSIDDLKNASESEAWDGKFLDF